MTKQKLNDEVTDFLDNLSHPLRAEIETLRQIILSSNPKLDENIKWNAPNYSFGGEDRITMKIQPSKQVQIIFHRGAKVLQQPKDKLINEESKILTWKTNDRAVATFKNAEEIDSNKTAFAEIVNDWLNATS